ncbi:MAG: Flp pilus assembly complex ATPase component TadA [Blastocatellia bacterium]|nr:Flp pilus assembly complex ATPase component TadA [Blastocatellia bacterium]
MDIPSVRALARFFDYGQLVCNPGIASLLSAEFCRTHKVILIDCRAGQGTKILSGAVADGNGEKALQDWFHLPESLDQIRFKANLRHDQIVRFKPKTYSEAEILSAIEKFCQDDEQRKTELQRYADPKVATLIPHATCKEQGILLAYCNDLLLHGWYTNPRGKGYLSGVLKSDKTKEAVLRRLGLSIELLPKLATAIHAIEPQILDRELRRIFQESESLEPKPQDLREIDHRFAEDFKFLTPVVETAPADENLSGAESLLRDLVSRTQQAGASDLLLYPDWQKNQLTVKILKDDRAVFLPSRPFRNPEYMRAFFLHIIQQMGKSPSDRVAPINGRLNVMTKTGFQPFRVAIQQRYEPRFLLEYSPLICLRQIDLDAPVPVLEDVVIEEYDRTFINEILELRDGLTTIGGPTGTGKSHTADALFYRLFQNQPSLNMGVVGNPIERLLGHHVHHFSLEQTPGPDIMATCLRQAIRALFVSESNEPKTAELANDLATTSALVLLTLHYDDPFDTPARLKTLRRLPGDYSSVLKYSMTQRLVRLNCPTCTVSERFLDRYDADPKFKARWMHVPKAFDHWGLDIDTFEHSYGTGLVKGEPCLDCRFHGKSFGTVGRRAVFEFLPMHLFSDLLYEDVPKFIFKREVANSGYRHRTLKNASFRLAVQGIVSLESIRERMGPVNPVHEMVPGMEGNRSTYYNNFDAGQSEIERIKGENVVLHQTLREYGQRLDSVMAQLAHLGAAPPSSPKSNPSPSVIDADVIDEEAETETKETVQ